MASSAASSSSTLETNRPPEHHWSAILYADIVPLAKHKGQQHVCELCTTVARFSCHVCQRAFYCSEKHRSDDWAIIHQDICHLIAFIRSPVDQSLAITTRDRIKKQKKIRMLELIDTVFHRAKVSLYEKRAMDALVQVRYCLRFSIQVYGAKSAETIPYHLVMTEAYSQVGEDSMATICMSRVDYIVEEDPNCSDSLKADYYRNKGKMFMSQGKLGEALINHAQQIYFASEAFHTEHPKTASGYFNLGQIFYLMNDLVNAFWVFLHTVEIWYTRLRKLDEEKVSALKAVRTSIIMTEIEKTDMDGHALQELLEAKEALTFINQHMVKESPDVPTAQKIKIAYTLALYYHLADEHAKALDSLTVATSLLSDCPSDLDEPVRTLKKRSERMLRRKVDLYLQLQD